MQTELYCIERNVKSVEFWVEKAHCECHDRSRAVRLRALEARELRGELRARELRNNE